MELRLLNDFKVGADPEFVLADPPSIKNAEVIRRAKRGQVTTEPVALWGYDHSGWVLEPHPMPSKSCREVVKGIRVALNQIARVFGGEYRWRAGADFPAPERTVTLGGHVHIDKPRPSGAQILAFDNFNDTLEALDILPKNESVTRRSRGLNYGERSDIRTEHGHFEYRTMCSWLYSQKASMLALTGIKLGTVAPETLPKRLGSYKELKAWFEQFKGKDDDVDWILNKGYFDKDLTAHPDWDIKRIWRVDPENREGLPEKAPEPEARGLEPGMTTADMEAVRTATGAAILARERAAQVRTARQAQIANATPFDGPFNFDFVPDEHF